jgi:hypothetical protein
MHWFALANAAEEGGSAPSNDVLLMSDYSEKMLSVRVEPRGDRDHILIVRYDFIGGRVWKEIESE